MARIAVLICMILTLVVGRAFSATITLPNEAQTTTFTATVSEQVNVSVPASVSFTVNSVSAQTNSIAQNVSATTIVLTDGKKLRVEIAPNDTAFTPPSGGTTTWASSDVSWSGTWTNGTANNSAMSASANTYVKLVDMTSANAASLSSTDLVFTLAAKTTVDRAGSHTLAATWKFSSF